MIKFIIRLTPIVDSYGILRVGGRLHHAKIDTESKHPIIIPRRSSFTTLVIAEARHQTLHGGTQLTLGLVRRVYDLLDNGWKSSSIYFVVFDIEETRAQQLTGQLPSSRVVPITI